MRAQGLAGELRVGYQRAALLGAWSFNAPALNPATKFSIVAKVKSVDSYWVKQRGLLLELPFGRNFLKWTDVECEVEEGTARITVTGRPTIER